MLMQFSQCAMIIWHAKLLINHLTYIPFPPQRKFYEGGLT